MRAIRQRQRHVVPPGISHYPANTHTIVLAPAVVVAVAMAVAVLLCIHCSRISFKSLDQKLCHHVRLSAHIIHPYAQQTRSTEVAAACRSDACWLALGCCWHCGPGSVGRRAECVRPMRFAYTSVFIVHKTGCVRHVRVRSCVPGHIYVCEMRRATQ